MIQTKPLIRRKKKKLLFWKFFIIKFVLYGGFFLALFLIIAFYTGLHNLDTGQNMRYLEARFNATLIDIASDNKEYSSIECITIGMNQVRIGFICMTALTLGSMLDNLVNFMRSCQKKK